MFVYGLQMFWAAVKEFILPYGTGGVIIAACIIGYIFTDSIPVVGGLFKRFRVDLVWIAVITAGVMVFMTYIIHLSNRACEAKQVVITNTLHKTVKKVQTPPHLPDPYDAPEN